jgi:hypothetical protein
VNWINRVKSAFQRLKNLNVKNKEVKEWGVNIVTQLLKIVGIDSKAKCPPRKVVYTVNYTSALIVEMRVPFCEPQDVERMNKAVRILAKEAEELTPVDTGRLRDSQYTLVFTEQNNEVVVGVVGYEISDVRRFRTNSGFSEAVFYALAVHNRDANHTTGNNPPRASWRFLELAQTNRNIQAQIQDLFA